MTIAYVNMQISKQSAQESGKEASLLKRLILLWIAAAAIICMTGCSEAEKNSEREPDESTEEQTDTVYRGNKGWSIAYDESAFAIQELEKGRSIELIYTGDCKGSAYVELVEIADKSAEELIKEKQSEYEKTSEVYEVKNKDKPGYVFYVPGIVPDKKDGNDRYTSVEVIPLEAGSLIITASQMMDEEYMISDKIADVINSIEIS